MERQDGKALPGRMPPRFMVAAPHGRSGKTVVTVGLCALLARSGVTTQPFKKGPDYIDASWLTAAAGRRCRNLDAFLMPETSVVQSFERASAGTDMAVIEGNMGFYDGFDGSGSGSSAALARLLGTPVILVVNTSRMTRSVAALVKGYREFEPESGIEGVILNNVAGERHRQKLAAAIGEYTGLPVLGAIPRDGRLSVQERHLGLVPVAEADMGALAIERILRVVEQHVDIEGVLSIARRAVRYDVGGSAPEPLPPRTARIGVFLDRAFHFYYPENLEALEDAGAELVFLDATKDPCLPAIDGLYIGGGFPEMYREELSRNRAFMHDVAAAVEDGLPVYAECAGLIYLCRSLRMDGSEHTMAGIIPADVEFEERPQGHGYVEAETAYENPVYPVGTALRGHEFHHTRLDGRKGLHCALAVKRGRGIGGGADGIVYKNLFASYTHVHALGTPSWAPNFVGLAARGASRKRACNEHERSLEVSDGRRN